MQFLNLFIVAGAGFLFKYLTIKSDTQTPIAANTSTTPNSATTPTNATTPTPPSLPVVENTNPINLFPVTDTGTNLGA